MNIVESTDDRLYAVQIPAARGAVHRSGGIGPQGGVRRAVGRCVLQTAGGAPGRESSAVGAPRE
jgi:hypothetical protein